MSMIESTAPTSWKLTRSTGTPCTRASASARAPKAATARSFTGWGKPEWRIIPRICAQSRLESWS
jgi:hypothetical protein